MAKKISCEVPRQAAERAMFENLNDANAEILRLREVIAQSVAAILRAERDANAGVQPSPLHQAKALLQAEVGR